MSIKPKFESSIIEKKWYKYWMDNKYFSSKPDKRDSYSIVIPPPNVTGVLHMGHMLNNCIQDILIRRARMMGYNACWVPGTDHASIATEAKVVSYLKGKGIEKNSITREKFLEYSWEWTKKYGGEILNQLQKIGCSCDWDRTKFTLDESMSESVIKVFVKLYNKGLIYRDQKMINWDPDAKTTVSDEEVFYEERSSNLYYISYEIENSSKNVVIATSRPETLLGDSALCINPSDSRYNNLIGKNAIVPIVNRVVPIIRDKYVDKDFGTGCLKVTPAHDINDKTLGEKHKLKFIDIFNEDGTLNSNGLHYKGVDRFEARKLIIKELKDLGLLVKKEKYSNNIAFSERTKAIIEPRLSEQWFLSMKTISKPAIKAVMKSKEISLFPKKFESTYSNWMENIHDWNISRQLWWGHQIPVYYIDNSKDNFVVAVNKEEALKLAKRKTGKMSLKIGDLKQEPDVLDTWFSSWLWPISVFDGIRNPKNKEINYYYPTMDLVTAPDILFFWVARMIISGYEFRNKYPFKNVYLTGIVRDKKGRKMSKQLGNSPEPLVLIKNFGADAVRVGLMLSSPAGNDLLFDESLCKQGKNFANKLWNAYRLIDSWKFSNEIIDENASEDAIIWYENKFNKTLIDLEEHFKKYRISDAMMTIYKLLWDDFCSILLEIIKPNYNQSISVKNFKKIKLFFENNLKILHPFMPFLSEELWQQLDKRSKDKALIISKWPKLKKYDESVIVRFDITNLIISAIRKFRKEKNLSFKIKLKLYTLSNKSEISNLEIIKKIGQIQEIHFVDKKPIVNGSSFRVKNLDFFVPLKENIDKIEEKQKLEKELSYTLSFLGSVINKLNNKNFVKNAPESIISIEKKKQKDAEIKINLIRKNLEEIS
ncbi:MAG: valine--tRNA ligase [Flavobacteriaceae bacterium]|nr:valine--tRNA ligase [Flavobacteriaceae bacterium]